MRGKRGAAGSHGENGSISSVWPVPSSGRVGCHGQVRVVQQLWSLIASSIEVMAHTKTGYRTSGAAGVEHVGDKGSQKKGEMEMCAPQSAPDSMPMGDGSEVNWSESVLGRSLLCRCVDLLRKNGDLQTLATVVCIFGGGLQLVSLMTPGNTALSLRVSVCPFYLPPLCLQLLRSYVCLHSMCAFFSLFIFIFCHF